MSTVTAASAVALGVVVGPALPRLPHLGPVGYVLFTGDVVPRLTSRPVLVTAAGAVGAALATASAGTELPQRASTER
jgi:hypothetical protein